MAICDVREIVESAIGEPIGDVRPANWRPQPEKLPGYLEDAPKNFSCPITNAILLDPVVCSDGQSYEHESIKRWLPWAPNSLVKLTKKEW